MKPVVVVVKITLFSEDEMRKIYPGSYNMGVLGEQIGTAVVRQITAEAMGTSLVEAVSDITVTVEQTREYVHMNRFNYDRHHEKS
jgi:hypothetical protein